MSTDFGFWKRASGDPGDVFDRLADGDTTGLDSSEDVLRFREDLLSRWPNIVHEMEPSDFDLEEDPGQAAKFVLLTLSMRFRDVFPEILALAKHHGLTGYSGVADEPL